MTHVACKLLHFKDRSLFSAVIQSFLAKPSRQKHHQKIISRHLEQKLSCFFYPLSEFYNETTTNLFSGQDQIRQLKNLKVLSLFCCFYNKSLEMAQLIPCTVTCRLHLTVCKTALTLSLFKPYFSH